MNYIVVFVTTSSEEEASKIARALVEKRLAGCVNIVKNIRSIYTWKDNIEDETEALMIIKTRKELYQQLIYAVKDLHSYSVPEIIALPIIEGSEDYLGWLDEVTR